MKLLRSVAKEYLSSLTLPHPPSQALVFIEGLVAAASARADAQKLIVEAVLLRRNVSEEFLSKTFRLLFSIRDPATVRLIMLLERMRLLSF